jgi:eukaryotic-like serine/threonine-protein kinase
MATVDPATLRALFDRAVSLPAVDRAEFVDRACGPNTALRVELERLLVAHDSGGSAFDDGTRLSEPHRGVLTAGAHLGPYTVESLLGAGGMGEVYKARDTRLHRTVAVKVLPASVSSDPVARHRFEREARAVAALSHPHICPIFDVGREGDRDYLVMEYLSGETLASRLRRGSLRLREALTLAIQIASALGAAHKAGIIHRDLKPGNIMLTDSGVRLLDFGLARQAEMAGRDATTIASEPLTGAGMILGTLPYMAPEQIEGRPADARTDIFAFGVVLYEMVTGRRAFDGASQAALIGSILRDDPPSLTTTDPSLPARLDRVIRRCVAKAPGERWPSMTDVQARLEALQEQVADLTAPPPPPVRRSRPRWARLAARGTVLLAVAGVTGWWVLGRTAREESPDAAHTAVQRRLHGLPLILVSRRTQPSHRMAASSRMRPTKRATSISGCSRWEAAMPSR